MMLLAVFFIRQSKKHITVDLQFTPVQLPLFQLQAVDIAQIKHAEGGELESSFGTGFFLKRKEILRHCFSNWDQALIIPS